MNWRLAGSLIQMRSELDTLFPKRDRTSDGAIGDAKHASRSSDHNPWVVDAKGYPVVTAIDVDRDITQGITSRNLAEFLRQRQDPRIKYVISNAQMFSSYANGQRKTWEWGPYTGTNAHKEHMHISVVKDQSLYDSQAPWEVGKGMMGLPVANHATVISTSSPGPYLRLGSVGEDVCYLQRMLGGLGVDGDFGPRTQTKVKQFQRRNGLDDSGVVDEVTWIVLKK